MSEYQPTAAAPEPAPPRPRAPGLAVASLLLGLATYLLCLVPGLVTAVPAVITGHLALARIRRAAGALGGRGMAIAGLVLGYVGIGLFLMFLAAMPFLLPAVMHGRDMALRASCRNNLAMIGKSVEVYAMIHGGSLPDRLSVLHKEQNLPLRYFVCPVTGHQIRSPDEIDAMTDYVYRGAGLRAFGDLHDVVVAYDKPGNHKDGCHVLFLDGRVEWRDRPPE